MKSRGLWTRGLFLFFLFSLPITTLAMGRRNVEFRQEEPLSLNSPAVVSKVRFSPSGEPTVEFATLRDTDRLETCALQPTPGKLTEQVNDLVGKISVTISDLKTLQSNRCAALTDRLKDANTQVSDAIKYRFLVGTYDPTSKQDQINAEVQRAGAVSALLLTATNIVNYQCVSSVTDGDYTVVQRLLGQVITLGGLFLGGWEGLGVAASGIVIANLPIFKNDIDRAVETLDKYKETNKDGSFLCLYRQMQKTSCTLFAPEDARIVNGFDTTLRTGAAATTFESIEKIKQKPGGEDLLADATLLQELLSKADDFLLQMKPLVTTEPTLDVFETFKNWCWGNSLLTKDFKNVASFPPHINESAEWLRSSCQALTNYHWDEYTRSKTAFGDFIRNAYWNLQRIKEYYNRLKKDENSELGKTIKTWESALYFKNLVKVVDEYRNSTAGNQERLNFLHMTEKLGNTLAKGSFKKMMKADAYDLTSRGVITTGPLRDFSIRKRALHSILDLCQTFDPSLACLYIDRQQSTSFYKFWESQCVGPNSSLCKPIRGMAEKDLYLSDPNRRAYFDSLCDVQFWRKTDSSSSR